MRFAVEHVLSNLAAGETVESLLRDYPALEREDVQACLLYASRTLAGECTSDTGAVAKADDRVNETEHQRKENDD